ncbi:MAG: hypothetical protein ACREEM_01005 [Blastocatellia bacterium]
MTGKSLSVCFLCCLSTIILAQTPTKPASAGTATVSGRVVLKGEPARGVALALLPQPGGPVNPASIPRAKSDENGRFRFMGVAAGSYSLQTISPGYVGAGDQQFYPRGKTVNIADGETLEDVEIELKRGGAIAGRISDSSGRPLIEERITLNQLDSSGKPQSNNFYMGNSEMYLTDDRGEYRIFGLPEGRYVVSAGSSTQDGPVSTGGSRIYFPRTYYADVANVTDAAQAKALEVTEASEAAGVDIVVSEGKRAYDIVGRVVDTNSGQPVAGLEIAYGRVAEDRKSFRTSGINGERSNANGEFRVRGLLPGRYGVFVRSTAESDFYSEPTVCEISDDNVQGVEVRVRLGTSLQGVVVLEGTNDPAVRLKLSQLQLHYVVRDPNRLMAPWMSSAKVATDGGFRIRGVPPGKVELRLFPFGNLRAFSLTRIEQNGITLRDGIEVRDGVQTPGVRVVVTYGAITLRGEMKAVGGALPPNLRLRVGLSRVDQSQQNPVGVEADVRGRFVIEGLSPGEYELRVSPAFYSTASRPDANLLRAFQSVVQRVTLSGANPPPVTLTVDLSQKEKQ